MVSPIYREWVRESARCVFCGGVTPAEPHHVPSVGAMGCTVDLLSAATCRDCHRRCHSGLIGIDVQRAAVWETWSLLARRYPEILRAAMKEMTEP